MNSVNCDDETIATATKLSPEQQLLSFAIELVDKLTEANANQMRIEYAKDVAVMFGLNTPTRLLHAIEFGEEQSEKLFNEMLKDKDNNKTKD